MTETQHPPRQGPRGDASNQLGNDDETRAQDTALLGRSAYQRWGQRHRRRLDRIFAGEHWTRHELDSWERAADHLSDHRLYGDWQVPRPVRLRWRRRGGDAA